jgi:oxygen-independent coproporphyrinogen-3 oxidase
MGSLGVYLHYPWCRKLCPYCDFAVAIDPVPPDRAYVDAIVDELAARAPAGRQLRTIYVGGGTPSMWDPACLGDAIGAIARAFDTTPAALDEITVEANPSDCTPERLAAWRDAGVGRVSIGVQSLDAGELRVLGRDHRHGDGPAALAAVRAAGFASVSCDFILGTPGGDGSSLARLADLAPDHLSVYELTIEPRTAFGKYVADGRLVPLDEDELATRYEAAHDLLAARGYEHYEVSSYARPGHRAIHNSLYWSGVEYLGLGAGAASYVDGARWTNHRKVTEYMAAAPGDRRAHVDPLAPDEIERDELWLAMRTADGVAADRLARWPDLVDGLVRDGLVIRRGDRICPTLRGFLHGDTIASRVVAVC